MCKWLLPALLAVALAGRAGSAAEPVEVTLDKGHLLHLDTAAKVVLVAQPGIVDAVIENPRTIFLLGRRLGETNLFVLDGAGREIMAADVVVVPQDDRHVTVNRSTEEATMSCYPRCAATAPPGAAEPGRAQPSPSPGGGTTGGPPRN